MNNPVDTAQTAMQLQQARELMAQGQPEKALAVALVALQQTMQHLREALSNLQRNLTRFAVDRQQESGPADSQPDAWPAGEKKTRYFH